MPKKILIVEDDQDIHQYYKIVLSDPGLELFYACSGKEGLNIVDAEEEIDLILLDIVMPEMNGEEFFRRLRVERKLEIPVILASVDNRMMEHLETIGNIQGAFIKGDGGNYLLKMVRDVLDL